MKKLGGVILVLVVLVLTGCGLFPEKAGVYNFKQGYDGLLVTTLEKTPPPEIYQKSNFKIILKVENKGAYEAKQGKVSIVGFVDKYVEIGPEQEIGELAGRSAMAPGGEVEFLEFPGRGKELLPGVETYMAPFFIKASYEYKTEFGPTVCINPQLYEVYEGGCKVEVTQTFKGQGSPLAVSELEEVTYPGENPVVEFRLRLENRGRGKIKEISLGQARLGNEPILCEFKGAAEQNKVKLKLGEERQEAVLICTKSLKSQNSYSTTLFTEFFFDYTVEEQRSLTIRR